MDSWSLRDCLQRTSFLRMPVLFTCSMPRNSSTGKVQKALVQAALEKDYEAERQSADELRATQRVQLAWYARIALPVLLPCVMQPWTFLIWVQGLACLDVWLMS